MNPAGVKRVIGPLPPYTEGVVLTHPGGDAELRCTYERDGALCTGGLRFRRVRAFRFRAEGHCTAWHIEDAYDTLVEIDDSGWVAELVAAQPSDMRDLWRMRHFLIYVDDAGAYELAAEEVEWFGEESSS